MTADVHDKAIDMLLPVALAVEKVEVKLKIPDLMKPFT
jgi:hypothetical protein